jgi:uncharacterized RDD family membrane protein YckC
MEALDTSREYETPEGVVLQLRIAGPVVRACAWAIDFLIRVALYLGLAAVFVYLGGVGTALILIGFFLIEWFYPAVFEAHNGATPGKKAMGLEVIHDNGTPLSWSSSLIRNLLRAADFLPLFYGFGLLSMLASRNFQRLGDLAAGSLVVYREQRRERDDLAGVEPSPPPMDLSLKEQEVLLDFAERRDRLSTARQEELAGLLTPLTGKQGPVAVNELLANAAWLARGR